MKSARFALRLDFLVPDSVDVSEPYSRTGPAEPIVKPRLQRARDALRTDARWTSVRVVSLMMHEQGSERIVVWVEPTTEVSDGNIEAAVSEVLRSVLPDARVAPSPGS